MKKINTTKLYRKDLANFAYWPLLPNFLETREYKEGFLKLDTGENIIEVPRSIMRKLTNLKVNFYPGVSDELVTLIAQKNKVDKEAIFLGNGSKDLLDLISRLFIDPGEEAIICSPTYPLYRYFIELSRGKAIDVPRKQLNEIDVEKIKKVITNKTKIIFIDNPSNPFGSLVSQVELREILDLGIIVVIDEAYYEFSGETALSLLKEYPNLVILRTFSKVMGMAGMRIAYSLTAKEIREALVKIKIPNQVNIAAQFLAKEIIKNVNIEERALQLIAGREYLLKELKKFPFLKVYPSKGAYVVVKIVSPNITVDDLYTAFYKNKILIKKMDFPDIKEEFLRINIVPVNIAKKIVKTLKNYEI